MRVERVLLDPAPLIAAMEAFVRSQSFEDYRWSTLALAAGVSERGIYRIRTGESKRVRLDIADKLAVAIGVPLSLIYPYDENEAA